jgi:hypothetical protein
MKRRRPRYWSPEPYQRVEMQQHTIEELRLVAAGGRPPEEVVAQLMQLGLVAAEGATLSLTAAGRHWVRRGAPQDDAAHDDPGHEDAHDDADPEDGLHPDPGHDAAGGEASRGDDSPSR